MTGPPLTGAQVVMATKKVKCSQCLEMEEETVQALRRLEKENVAYSRYVSPFALTNHV